MLKRGCCFFDLARVAGVGEDGELLYNPRLPDYLGDMLSAYKPPLVGLAFSDWGGIGHAGTICDWHPQKMHVRILDVADPMPPLFDLCRQFSLDLAQCFVYLDPTCVSAMEDFVRDAGVRHLRTLDIAYLLTTVGCL